MAFKEELLDHRRGGFIWARSVQAFLDEGNEVILPRAASSLGKIRDISSPAARATSAFKLIRDDVTFCSTWRWIRSRTCLLVLPHP